MSQGPTRSLPGRLGWLVDGSTLRTRTGTPLDADGDSAPRGVARASFSTVSIVAIPNTLLGGRLVDPRPTSAP